MSELLQQPLSWFALLEIFISCLSMVLLAFSCISYSLFSDDKHQIKVNEITNLLVAAFVSQLFFTFNSEAIGLKDEYMLQILLLGQSIANIALLSWLLVNILINYRWLVDLFTPNRVKNPKDIVILGWTPSLLTLMGVILLEKLSDDDNKGVSSKYLICVTQLFLTLLILAFILKILLSYRHLFKDPLWEQHFEEKKPMFCLFIKLSMVLLPACFGCSVLMFFSFATAINDLINLLASAQGLLTFIFTINYLYSVKNVVLFVKDTSQKVRSCRLVWTDSDKSCQNLLIDEFTRL